MFTCGEQSGYVHFGELLLSVSSGERHPTSLVVVILYVHFGELLLGVSSGKHHPGVHASYLAGGGDSGGSLL